MLDKVNAFLKSKSENSNQLNSNKFNKIVSNYKYIYCTQNTLDQELENITNSSVIMINHYKDDSITNEELHFIIVFHETVLYVKQSLLSNLKLLLLRNDQFKICFYCEYTKQLFDDNEELEKIDYIIIDNYEELKNISKNFFINSGQFSDNNFLNQIKSCISGYIIQKCYFDLNNYDRVKDFNPKEEIEPIKIKESELIELQTVGIGSLFKVDLYYHIYDEKLYTIKKPYVFDPEIEKLLTRENSNLSKIRHPFIPKYYGTVDIDRNNCPVIEFINGRTLLEELKSSQLTELEKLKIIAQLISVVKYLHEKRFICRDLKPDNFIIDKKKNLVVIDFDRMIEEKDVEDENIDQSKIFDENFHAPEINDKNLTNKCDIYSIGKIIYMLIPNIETDEYYKMIYSIYKDCINENPSNRHSASFLFCLFRVFFEKKEIKIDLSFDINMNDLYNLGLIYYENQYISQDIDKSIYYFTLAANYNHSKAQYYLGLIYYEDQDIFPDIEKAINYFTLAAYQNDSEAQYYLGIIYYEDIYVSRDINKAINYFTLSANQNDRKAQYYLGLIYYEDIYVSRDINKAIHYFTLAANQNHLSAQYYLGLIYYEDIYVSRDINKAINYFTLAANQNHLNARIYLGYIYWDGQFFSRDIKKAIYYFTLVANQNHPKARLILGLIYYSNQVISRDINKAIHYFTLAANQDDKYAQYYLGLIYYDNQVISRDINKAIHYFTLSANQNGRNAQYYLGLIYYKGIYISRDINKSIHYFTLSANQNDKDAQYYLGLIYYNGQYISQNINKSITYFTLSANQNDRNAQYCLGLIYYNGQYISRDINKSIYYFTLSANQNYPKAQFFLGYIYYEGQYISRDINKAIYYLTLASNQNFSEAQYFIGLIYFYMKQDIKKGIYWISISSQNDCIGAHFALGFLYQEGKYMKRDIDESIKYYKKASSFNDQYSKNNLGIIYKNYFEKKYDYTVYFEEAIRQKSDPVSMYNLAHAYIYEYQDEKLINKSIELLIKSSNLGFEPSTELLCLIMIKRFIFKQTNGNELINIEDIKKGLSEFTEKKNELEFSIINIIQKQKLHNRSIFEHYYKKYAEVEFVYDLFPKPMSIKNLYNEENELKLEDSNEEHNITTDFYEGFGKDINICI